MCRRYMGHKRTIRPNAKKLNVLFQRRNQMGWDMFSLKVQKVQRGLMGEPDDIRPKQDDFHEFPSSCICLRKPRNISVTTWTESLRAHEVDKRRMLLVVPVLAAMGERYICFERNMVELRGQADRDAWCIFQDIDVTVAWCGKDERRAAW